MTNPTQAQIDKLTTNLTRWDSIINGAEGDTVALDTQTVKSVKGYLNELKAFTPRGTWATSTAYAVKDVAISSGVVYVCLTAHTSGGSFATDYAANKWAVYQLDVTGVVTFPSGLVSTGAFTSYSLLSVIGGGTPATYVTGTIAAYINSGSVSTNSYLNIQSGTSGLAGISLGDSSDDDVAYVRLDNSTNVLSLVNSGQSVSLNSSGYMGIGTTSPAYKLDVQSGFGVIARFNFSDATYNPRLAISGSSAGVTLNLDYSTAASNIMLGVGGTEYFRFNSAGLGIGTQTVSAKVHAVSTGTIFRGGYNDSNYIDLQVGSTGDATFSLTGTTPKFKFSNKMEIAPASASGVQEALRLIDLGSGASEGPYIRWDSESRPDMARIGAVGEGTGGGLGFYTNSANSGTPTLTAYLSATGNLGVNNASPTQKLDIGGIVKSTNRIVAYTSTATAAGTTTLTVSSSGIQDFTGSTTQTVVLPVVSTLETGFGFVIINHSSGNVTVQSSGANTLATLTANQRMDVICKSTSGTGTSSWTWAVVSIGG